MKYSSQHDLPYEAKVQIMSCTLMTYLWQFRKNTGQDSEHLDSRPSFTPIYM